MDFIALHGIWSWITSENRQIIVDFISKKLKVGGVLYISYNTLPGWSAQAPMRHLLTQHYQKLSSADLDTSANIKKAIDKTAEIIEHSTALTAATPKLKSRVDDLKNTISIMSHMNISTKTGR